MAVDHYENFPVASLLLPRRLRDPVRNIYRFARSADDIADEGDAPACERLDALAAYRDALDQMGRGELRLPQGDPRKAVFEPLAATIQAHRLPLQPFFDLISAFEQDVTTTRYPDDERLLDYCRRSANPVGRIMLHLYGHATPDKLAYSDAICTGLQLTNFWQDVAIDWRKGRVYIPLDKFARHHASLAYISDRTAQADEAADGRLANAASRPRSSCAPDGDPAYAAAQEAAWQAMMRAQVEQARGLLRAGLPLTRQLPGRIGWELRLVVQGGLRVLERLDQLHYDIFFHRPTLKKSDWLILLWRALG